MKQLLIFFVLGFTFQFGFSQEKTLYIPTANATKDIKEAISRAKKENKLVLIQGGGNWCSWCLEFARFCKADKQIDSLIQQNFIWHHLNYSKENKNEKAFSMLDHPERFGFPVFIILDKKGNRIHTQNSEYLEDGKKSYDRKKVISFLEMWTPAAIQGSLQK